MRRRLPVLARLRHLAMSASWSLTGGKRTSSRQPNLVEIDPTLTSAADADRRATEAASYDTCLPNIRIPRKVLKGGFAFVCASGGHGAIRRCPPLKLPAVDHWRIAEHHG
jgi:hypothetical protein